MLVFDIGANIGEATAVALNKLGADKVVALEPAPKMISRLANYFSTDPRVVPLKLAVSNTDDLEIEFYECVEDGLSTTNLDWLEDDSAPYKGKPYKTIKAYTVTLDSLIKTYGEPDLMKVDVEGAELSVLEGLTHKSGTIAFEWHINWYQEVDKCLEYLYKLGYKEFAPQYIVQHLQEPVDWYPIHSIPFIDWQKASKDKWENGLWKEANLRPTADAGMIWVK